jgi:hypothetical protein
MSMLLLVVLLLVIFGGGFGFYGGYVGPGGSYNILGIILFVFVLLLVLGMLGPWHHPFW